jgi:hypothetical protein
MSEPGTIPMIKVKVKGMVTNSSVVDRHRFNADSDPNFMLMPIQIRIGILIMPILKRILPQVSHLLENSNFFTFSHSFASLQYYIFLIRWHNFKYLGQHNENLWKLFQMHRSGSPCPRFRSGYGKIMRILPNPHPDPQHCNIGHHVKNNKTGIRDFSEW